MTDEMMSVRALVEKSPDTDLLREMIGSASQRLMALEVGTLTGAPFGQKHPGRLVQRNGYRERDWQTRLGTVELRIPRLRRGSYFFADVGRRWRNGRWRPGPESNRRTRLCRPLHDQSAT
jgi:putative transposase